MNDKLLFAKMYTTIKDNGKNERNCNFNDENNENLLLHLLHIL
jgi:hypothetical protein